MSERGRPLLRDQSIALKYHLITQIGMAISNGHVILGPTPFTLTVY